MKNNFIQTKNREFILNDEKIMLRGFGIGTWMNIENFMVRIPGTEKKIRRVFTEVYGREKAVKKIRQVDNDHILFIEGDNCTKDFSFFKNLGGHQQAISFHLYPGQHVSIFADSKMRKAELEKVIWGFTKLREKTGMPLWAGETGGRFPKDHMSKGVGLIKDCIDLFEKHRISWSIWAYKDAKAMLLVYPKDHTDWMSLGNDFRSKWQTKERRNPTIAKEIFEMLEKKLSYSLSENLKNKLSFRIFALLNEIHTHQLVKPELQSIPWEEMKEYPKSFLWESCDYLREIAELFKFYTTVNNDKNTI